jgi:hypothetical protein
VKGRILLHLHTHTQADSQHACDPVVVVVLVLDRHHDRVLVVLADKVVRIAVPAPLGLDLEVGQPVRLLVTRGAGHVRHGFLHHERVGGRNVGGLALVDGLDEDARQVQFVAFVVDVHGLGLGGGLGLDVLLILRNIGYVGVNLTACTLYYPFKVI